jgi:anthranilate phosphoribosyltransferase
MHGTEGEAVVRTVRPQAIDYLHSGSMQTLPAADDTDPPSGEPALPDALDAQATARWIDDAMSGHAAMPASIRDQADALMRIVRRP